jgi:hypothetical protein
MFFTAGAVGAADVPALPKMTFIAGHWDTAPGTGALRPDPAIPWNIAVVESPCPAEVSVELRLSVRDSGTSVLGHSAGGRFVTRGADLCGENDLWADAALILDYDGSGPVPSFYRVEISAHPEAGNVAIWRSGGGYLAQKPLAISLKQEHRLQVRKDKQGSIRVALDGTEVLAYRDPFPLKPGKVGVGALKALVEFTGLTVRPLEEKITVALPEKGNFRMRKLFDSKSLDEEWLFDGDEPVFRFQLKPSYEFQWVKVRPGIIPPVSSLPIFWTQWVGPDVEITKPDGYEIEREGEVFEIEMKVRPREGDAATGVIRVKVSRDAKALRYVYDVDTTLTVNKDKPLRYGHPLEFWDPWPHAAKGMLLEYERSPRQRWHALAWEQPGNAPPRRVDLALDYGWLAADPDGKGMTGSMPDYEKVSAMKPKGKAAMGLADDANLVMIYENDPGYQLYNELCNWGYDWHCRLHNAAWRKDGVPAGTVINLRFTFTHEERAALADLFTRSKHIAEDWYQDVPRPVMEWPTNTFARTVRAMSPHNSHIWYGGHYVTDRGNGDTCCMRLEPGNKLVGTLGYGLFTPAWVHHQNLRTMTFDALIPEGEGKVSVLCRTSIPAWNLETKKEFELSAGKTAGWRTFEVDATPFAGAQITELEFRNVGGKPFYIDNVAFKETHPPKPEYVFASFVHHGGRKPEWVMEAETLAGGFPTSDPDAGNGFALAVDEKHKKGTCFYGPYDAELPAGEYEGTIRVKVADNTLATPVIGWDIQQDAGAARYVAASGKWTGTEFPAPNRYEEKKIAFKRDAGGRFCVRIYQEADGGKFWVDQVRLRRVKDGWGNPLPEKRERW